MQFNALIGVEIRTYSQQIDLFSDTYNMYIVGIKKF